MNDCKQNQKIRKAINSVVAVFFVIYILADVSVLQIVHGSENVGIPPQHHSVDADGCLSRNNRSSTHESKQASFSQTDKHHNSDEDCSDEGECLASCSHIIVSYFAFNPPIDLENGITHNPLDRENTTPMSEPSDIFHPPQIA